MAVTPENMPEAEFDALVEHVNPETLFCVRVNHRDLGVRARIAPQISIVDFCSLLIANGYIVRSDGDVLHIMKDASRFQSGPLAEQARHRSLNAGVEP